MKHFTVIIIETGEDWKDYRPTRWAEVRALETEVAMLNAKGRGEIEMHILQYTEEDILNGTT
jgi:hypothetical protein